LNTMWGISLDDGVAVVKGVSHTLTRWQRDAVEDVVAKVGGQDEKALNAATCDSFPSRAQTRDSWAIGSPYLGTIEETARVERQRGIRPFTSGPTYDALLLILGACLVYAGVRVLHPDRKSVG